jgi:hypothetical protein
MINPRLPALIMETSLRLTPARLGQMSLHVDHIERERLFPRLPRLAQHPRTRIDLHGYDIARSTPLDLNPSDHLIM